MQRRPSPYRTAAHRTAGFTLAELLATVAIVAVLVAVAVPVFTGALGSSEEATCAANRRALKSMYATAWLLDQTSGRQQELFDDCLETLMDQNRKTDGDENPLCPSNGRYTAVFDVNGGAIVKCSKHGLSIEDAMNQWVADKFEGNTTGYVDGGKLRESYAKDHNLSEWPEVTGADGKPYYIQLKNYQNNPSGIFLYAGYEKQITGGSGQWNARYICDSTGLVGAPGQWYEVPERTNVSMTDSPDGKGKDKMKALLEQYKDKKVSLVGDEFKSAAASRSAGRR